MINEFVATLRNTNFDRLLFSSVKFNVITFIQKSRNTARSFAENPNFLCIACLPRSLQNQIHTQTIAVNNKFTEQKSIQKYNSFIISF